MARPLESIIIAIYCSRDDILLVADFGYIIN